MRCKPLFVLLVALLAWAGAAVAQPAWMQCPAGTQFWVGWEGTYLGQPSAQAHCDEVAAAYGIAPTWQGYPSIFYKGGACVFWTSPHKYTFDYPVDLCATESSGGGGSGTGGTATLDIPVLNLSASDGALIAGAILALWAVGYSFRVLIQVLRKTDGDPQTIESE